MELHHIADEEMGGNEIKIFHESLNKMLRAGRHRRLSEYAFEEIYKLFCKVSCSKYDIAIA